MIGRLRLSWSVILGGGALLLVLVVAVAAPLLPLQDPLEQNIRSRYGSPSPTHLFGADQYGRDVLSRVVFGTRTSLLIAALSVGSAMAIGVPLGMYIGYRGGIAELVTLWVCDVILAYPTVVLGIILLVSLGAGFTNVIVVVSIAFVPRFIRLTRGLTKSTRENDYIVSCRAVGLSMARTFFHHILPNVAASLITMSSLWIGTAIRMAAGLSFIGLGVQPPYPSLGNVMRDGANALHFAPHIALYAGIFTFIIIMGFLILGDDLQSRITGRG